MTDSCWQSRFSMRSKACVERVNRTASHMTYEVIKFGMDHEKQTGFQVVKKQQLNKKAMLFGLQFMHLEFGIVALVCELVVSFAWISNIDIFFYQSICQIIWVSSLVELVLKRTAFMKSNLCKKTSPVMSGVISWLLLQFQSHHQCNDGLMRRRESLTNHWLNFLLNEWMQCWNENKKWIADKLLKEKPCPVKKENNWMMKMMIHWFTKHPFSI